MSSLTFPTTTSSIKGTGTDAANPESKRHLVWHGMDQKELDDAYDQVVWAPNRDHVNERRRLASKKTLASIPPPARVPYGPTDNEQLDIYRTNRSNAPIHIFLHGGAWRVGLAKEFAFAAETFLAAGICYVVPDFVPVQSAGGSLMPIADQVRRAVAWVYKNAATFGGDPNRIYLSGHSSGGHLAGVCLVTDWQEDFGLPADILKGGLCISGLYDLKPVRLSARSNYVKFDDATEQALSPQRHLAKLNTPVIVAYGVLESPEFQRQACDFVRAIKAAGKPAELIVGEGYNHFEILETLGNPFGLLGRAALEQMKLTNQVHT
jgi:arylformamidase